MSDLPQNSEVRERFVLWLDDVREVPQEYKDGNYVHAKTAQMAITLLRTCLITHISFDHDLGDEALVGNGYLVAKAIEDGAHSGSMCQLTWAVHSQNPVGAKNIMAAMLGAERWWRPREVNHAKQP
jgi:hypothetical protein